MWVALRGFVCWLSVAGAVADAGADAGAEKTRRTARAALGGFHTGWSLGASGDWVAVRRQAELFVETGSIAKGEKLVLEWRRLVSSVARVTVFWNRAVVFTGALPRESARVEIALPETKAGRQEIGFDFSGGRKFRAVMGATRRQRGKLVTGQPFAAVSLASVPSEVPSAAPPLAECAVPASPVNPFAGITALPNVLFYVVDTLRADHVGRALHRVKTPNFDRIAANGVRFERAVATSSWSKPTIATLLTGLYPGAHGCNAHDDKLPATKAMPTMAEQFRAAGHATAAVVANGYIAAQHGFVRGFDFVRNPLREGRPYRAERLNDIALKWLRAKADRKPFFLHMQPVDPHVPYNPPRRFWSRFFPGRYVGPLVPAKTGDQLDLIKTRALRLGERDRAFLHALYDGAVEYTDFAFGELMKALDAMGLAKETLVVITADHGEEFWEHGSVGHAHTVYEELVRVPFIVGTWGTSGSGSGRRDQRKDAETQREEGSGFATLRLGVEIPCGGGCGSGSGGGGQIVDATVSTVDLVNGLRDLYKMKTPNSLSTPQASRPAFSIVLDRVVSVTWGRCKYVLWRGGAEELFRLDGDSGESRNLIRTEPAVLRALRGRLAEWFAFENRPATTKGRD
ncbi:MAG: sulfatase [Deltaproteobacteria bacterium]|nr:sulfatase [Deltaproteobacteria bacterium]